MAGAYPSPFESDPLASSSAMYRSYGDYWADPERRGHFEMRVGDWHVGLEAAMRTVIDWENDPQNSDVLGFYAMTHDVTPEPPEVKPRDEETWSEALNGLTGSAAHVA